MANLQVEITIKGHIHDKTSVTDLEDALAISLSRFQSQTYGLYMDIEIKHSASVGSVLQEIERGREGLIA